MFTKTYDQTVQYLGENAPTLDKPTPFIRWAEEMADLVHFIYSVDYDTATEDIIQAAKDSQDYDD